MERPVWDRIQEIYYSALPLVQSERGTFVSAACGFDPVLEQEVISLLEADDSSGDFLESPVFEKGLRIISSSNDSERESSSRDDLIGTTIDGRYLVEKELGRGGIGAVYLARDLSLHHRRVVIKILLQASLQDPYVVRKFEQEVEALARIDHPNIVGVLGAGKLADGKHFIGMQYVNGDTLRSQIPGEGMDLERAASILKQIGVALDEVHGKGIFHRDLKPENIMLQALRDGTELVKIVDFGIAKVKDSVIAPSTINEAAIGTVLCMSPEQLRGEKVTAASDIYSMAIIAYEMVTGRRPFNPGSGPQLLEMHRAGVRVKPIDLRSNLSTEAQAVILRGLSFEPNDRYQRACEFGDSLARTLVNDGETADLQARNDGERRQPAPAGLKGDFKTTLRPGFEPPVTHDAGGTRGVDANANQRSKLSSSWVKVLAASLLVLVGITGFVGVYMFRRRSESPKSSSGPSRSFNYWLTVQKMRDGKRYQEPFQSSGQEIFENGYKFRLNVYSPEPGYLYLFNEGPPDTDGASFTIIYPTIASNSDPSANQSVQTNWNTFRGQPGTEDFWIVWSASPITELEAAKTEAFKNPKGALTDSNMISAVKEFLTKHSEPKPRTTKDANTQQTRVRGAGDILVKLAKLEHR